MEEIQSPLIVARQNIKKNETDQYDDANNNADPFCAFGSNNEW